MHENKRLEGLQILNGPLSNHRGKDAVIPSAWLALKCHNLSLKAQNLFGAVLVFPSNIA